MLPDMHTLRSAANSCSGSRFFTPLTLKMPSQEFGTQTDMEDFDLATFEYVFFFLTNTMLAIQCKLDV